MLTLLLSLVYPLNHLCVLPAVYTMLLPALLKEEGHRQLLAARYRHEQRRQFAHPRWIAQANGACVFTRHIRQAPHAYSIPLPLHSRIYWYLQTHLPQLSLCGSWHHSAPRKSSNFRRIHCRRTLPCMNRAAATARAHRRVAVRLVPLASLLRLVVRGVLSSLGTANASRRTRAGLCGSGQNN